VFVVLVIIARRRLSTACQQRCRSSRAQAFSSGKNSSAHIFKLGFGSCEQILVENRTCSGEVMLAWRAANYCGSARWHGHEQIGLHARRRRYQCRVPPSLLVLVVVLLL
jgi:hypothetical protein